MQPDEIIAIALVCRRIIKNRRKKKKVWVQPMMTNRLEEGAFYTVFNGLLESEEKFFDYFKMSRRTFHELYAALEHSIRLKDTLMRKCIPAKERLAVTLRFLAEGCTLTEIHYAFKIGISTLSSIIRDVCKKIWNLLQETCMAPPTCEGWREISEVFNKRANFPNCLGAIDGKRVRITKPVASTIVLIAICDADYRFTSVDIQDHGTVFRESEIWQKLASKRYAIPKPAPLPNTEKPLPYVFVGDEAFVLSTNVMRPYAGTHMSSKKKIFNYRLSRARRFIESAFSILTSKWCILQKPLNISGGFAGEVVRACVILHNFVLVRDGYKFDDTFMQEGLLDMDEPDNQRNQMVGYIRDGFGDYFEGVGAVPWQ